MTQLTSAETALLGLLCEGEVHAYQLEKTVAYRCMRDWTDLSMSTIYKTMRKLERLGFALGRTETTPANKMRKTYAVTPAGRQAIAGQLLHWLREPETMKYRLDLATYNLDLVPRAQAMAALRAYRDALQKGIACYQKLDDFMAKEGCPPYRLALARRPRFLLAAEINWVDAFIREMNGGKRAGRGGRK